MTAEFQERIRNKFPNAIEVTDESDLPIPDEMSEQFPRELVDSLAQAINRRFQFKTFDEIWTVNLTRNFVALETSKYVNWEEFREYTQLILSAILKSYALPFFTRIGLRYVNIIDRELLGLEQFEWSELLAGFIAGPLVLSEQLHIPEQRGSFQVEYGNPLDIVHVRHGLLTDVTNESKSVYVLDNDFFTNDETITEVDDVIGKVDGYNTQNRRLFRSCIKDTLHTAMGPLR
jgi:uncharacterized protein (TIGR04255 family)